MTPALGRATSLRRRLFGAIALIVVCSLGLTLAVGLVLTRRSVKHDVVSDLGRRATLIARQEQARLVPLSGLGRMEALLEQQGEEITHLPLADAGRLLPDDARARLARGEPAQGSLETGGRQYLYAARRVEVRGRGEALVLLRSAELRASDWRPFAQGLLLAGFVGALLAAGVSLLLARAITRPVGLVAAASRDLAQGGSPKPIPVEGSDELAQLASAFNDMAAQLARARELERAFLLSVSHELKTPLTAIRGYAEAVAEGAIDATEAAETISVEARRLERLVHDLLDLARMNRSTFTVHREPVDLADVAREAVRRYEPQAQAFNVALELAADGVAPASGDYDRVLQVVSNLVENALRSTPAGGSVAVGAAPGVLSVRDTGPGLAPDELPRAFERFYLFERYRARRPVGTGLGLAIVKELTEAMGGRVDVRSRPGEGTAFFVRLPRGVDGTPHADRAQLPTSA